MSASITTGRPSLLRRAALRAGAILSAGAIAACQPSGGNVGAVGPESGQMIDPGQPVKVALLVPGGSGNPNVEVLARSLKNAAQMAVADAQGATIDLSIYDTGGDTAKAVAQANAAADAGAKIIVGPLYAEAANAVGSAMAPRSINVLSFSNNSEIAGGNVFVMG